MYPFSLAACVKRKRGFREVNSQPGARRKQLLRDKTSRGQERRSTKRKMGKRMKAPNEISFLYEVVILTIMEILIMKIILTPAEAVLHLWWETFLFLG